MEGVNWLLTQYCAISKKDHFKESGWQMFEQVSNEISHILEWKELKELRELLILLTKHWTIWVSDNIWNTFEQEKEVKVLDIDYDKVIKKLKALEAKEVFDGVIDDIYLDLPEAQLENKDYKVSFRLRFKYSNKWELRFFYTLKRKRPKNKKAEIATRDCYEKEFEIRKPWLVMDLLKNIWLKAYRRKIKKRIAFVIRDVKFDIDSYWIIPPLLEIETDRPDQIPWILGMLKLDKNELSSSGSRWLFRHYDIEDKYILIEDKESWLSLPEHLVKKKK